MCIMFNKLQVGTGTDSLRTTSISHYMNIKYYFIVYFTWFVGMLCLK